MKSARVQQDDNARLPPQPSNPSSPVQSVPSAEPGTMHISSQGTTYFASPHWEAIMDEISDLKDQFRRTDESQTSIEPTDSYSPGRKTSNTPLLLYGSMQPLSQEVLISALPERSVADRIIFQYFNEVSILPARVVHPPRFLEQYEEFWANPSAVSLSWLGLLYGVLSLSHFFSSEPDHRQSQPQPKHLERLVQCLIAADYVRGGPYILECLIHYYLVEFYLNPVTEVGNWMVAGMMAQLAFRMGYHRDPSHFPRISAFEGEMRRRVWATVHILNSTMAMLIGAPRIISDGTWDTRPPKNISDADLDQDCAQLPESRADSEVTEVSFLLARYKMSLAMGRLVDLSLMNKLELPEDVNSAETRLEEAYELIPEKFKFTLLVHCLSDKPLSVAHRVIITCLYNKSRIILYQRQLRKRASTSSAGGGSSVDHEDWTSAARCKCIEAALEIIKHLVFLDTESQPGGTLTAVRSKISALVVHEGLVATAALSTYLYRWSEAPPIDESGGAVSKPEIEAMLRRSYETWSNWSNWSAEARRAVELLDLLFRKLGGNNSNIGIDEAALPMDEMDLGLDWDADTLGIFFPLSDEPSI
ncbi:Trichosetin biosynthesis cluster transcription factor TF23 [Colletotrichum siamense]|nr:Trichosetin biosynthesis cluster transcription factor TF23 [Colletotrichum siamense]